METLFDKLQPVLTAEGVLYQNVERVNKDIVTVLKEVRHKEKVSGFRAYHRLTNYQFGSDILVSDAIGNPQIYVVMYGDEPIDYSSDFNFALEKAHEYLSDKIKKLVLHPGREEPFINFLDTTALGKEKFLKLNGRDH